MQCYLLTTLWQPANSAGKFHELWHQPHNSCGGSIEPPGAWMQASSRGSCNMFPNKMIRGDLFLHLFICLFFDIGSNWTGKGLRPSEKRNRPLLSACWCLDQKCFSHCCKRMKHFLRSYNVLARIYEHIKYLRISDVYGERKKKKEKLGLQTWSSCFLQFMFLLLLMPKTKHLLLCTKIHRCQ